MDNEIAVLDTYTDARMYVNLVRSKDMSVWESVLDVQDYARYWHGYLIVLRPLALFLGYDEIRFLLGTVILLLFSAVTIKIRERLGMSAALTHAAALALSFFTLSVLCLQYVCCYVILFVGELVLLKKYRTEDVRFAFYALFVLGMLTNYFDFLTYPVMVLGGALILVLYIHYQEEPEYTLKKGIYILVSGTFTWGVGYVVTWLTKWVLATVVLRENIILDAIEQVIYRSYGGNEQGTFAGMVHAVRINLGALLVDRDGVILAVLLVGSLALFMVWAMRKKSAGKGLLPILVIAGYPYLWYMVLVQHSIQHAYFTYKAQMVTIWAILLLGAEGMQHVVVPKFRVIQRACKQK